MQLVRNIALIAFISHCTTTMAQQPDALLAEVMAKYQGAMQASFTHTMTSPIWDGEQVASGHIVLQDDLYRIETPQELIIGRGTDTWIWRPEDNQLLISTTGEDGLAFAPGALLRDYNRHYAALSVNETHVSGVPHYQLTLLPISEEYPVRDVVLWIRQSDHLITQIRALDNNDTQMDFRLRDIVPAVQVAPSTFEFSPPDDAEIIDLRS